MTEKKKKEVSQKLIDIFGSKDKAIEAANLALMYGEHLQDAAIDWYWYKPANEKIDILNAFVEEYKQVR